MNCIYTVINEQTGEVLSAFRTAKTAKQFVENFLIDEKNNEISLILLDKSLTKSQQDKAIEKIRNTYDRTLNKLDAYYEYYCNSNVILTFGVDEYQVSEVPFFNE